MQNSKQLEKSRGILAFANNTAETDYRAIAEQTVKLASRVWGLPYTILSTESELSNTRYNTDLGKFVEWRNFGRCQAYRLSPYDETIVMDVDYVVQDKEILKIFDQPWDYMLQRHSHSTDPEYPAVMGPHSLPFVWATVFAFRRSNRAEQFFNLVERIQNNYNYYRELFNIVERNYRNDYAFAIADTILNGFTVGTQTIPGSMLTVDRAIESISINNNSFVIKDSVRAYVVPRTNMHVMSKRYLQSENFKQFIRNVST
jgi:hypothetical protein